jgi:hypothetical protein
MSVEYKVVDMNTGDNMSVSHHELMEVMSVGHRGRSELKDEWSITFMGNNVIRVKIEHDGRTGTLFAAPHDMKTRNPIYTYFESYAHEDSGMREYVVDEVMFWMREYHASGKIVASSDGMTWSD